MKIGWIVLALPLAVALSGCSETPTAPEATITDHRVMMQMQPPGDGTGLVLESLTDVILAGDVTIEQAVITDLVVDEVAGSIVGLEAEGILTLTGGALGTDVLTEEFQTTAMVTSSGPGQCEITTVDLGPIDVGAPLNLVNVDVPEASVTARGSGAVGSLLCNLGSLLDPVTGTVIPAVRGIVNALNRLI